MLKRWKIILFYGMILLIIGGIVFLTMGSKQRQELLGRNSLDGFIMKSSFDSGDTRTIGYEYLDDEGNVVSESSGTSIHIWNNYDDYFFNKSSGIQLTNHFQDYWTKNVLCLRSYENGYWEDITCMDELSGSSYITSTDNSTYVNVTYWTDVTFSTYDIRLKINYHLKLEDGELTIDASAENIGKNINFDLGFVWRIKDVELPGLTTETIYINDTEYNLNDNNNILFETLTEPQLEIHNEDKYLWIEWDGSLDYDVRIYDEGTQDTFNSTLFINAGTFTPNQIKSTTFHWIDADTQVDGAVQTTTHGISDGKGLVWINESYGYIIFTDSGQDLHYRKTTDSGATWSDENTIDAGTIQKYSIWFDKWTSGDTGNIIHIVKTDSGTDWLSYDSLDTSDDSLNGEVVIHSWTSISAIEAWTDGGVSIVKSRAGTLYAGGWGDDAEGSVFYGSENGGANWINKSNVGDSTTVDRISFQPGNETDPSDIWAIYWDTTNNDVDLKVYDNSSNSWSRTTIDNTLSDEPTTQYQMDAVSRHSDDNSILAIWNDYDTATSELEIYEIGGSCCISQKTSLHTSDDSMSAGLLINQQNNELYVAYLGEDGGTETLTSAVMAYYKNSSDGGTTWSSERALSEDSADDLRAIFGGTSVGNDGGRWMPIWFNDDLNDLFVNQNTDIEISVLAVSWNQTTLDIGETQVNKTLKAEIDASGSHTNVLVDCHGDCDVIFENHTTTSMSNGESEQVNFTCDNSTSGSYWAEFNVTSTEDTSSNLINVTCDVFHYGSLEVQITAPTEASEWRTHWNNLTLNASALCTGAGGDVRCGTLYAWARYNGTGTSPDTWVNTTEGGLPFFVEGGATDTDDVYWRPVNFTEPVSDFELSIDNRYNDTSTDSSNIISKGAHANYTWDLSSSITSGTFFITYDRATSTIFDILIWNWNSNSWDTLDNLGPDGFDDDKTIYYSISSSSNQINATGGVLIQINKTASTGSISVMDAHILTQGGGTYDYWGITNPSTTTNATFEQSGHCTDPPWCSGDDEIGALGYRELNQSDNVDHDHTASPYGFDSYHIKINEKSSNVDSITVRVEYDTGQKVWIWNYNSLDWESITNTGYSMQGSHELFYETINTSVTNYIDSNGYIHILANETHTLDSAVDYVKVNIVSSGGAENPQTSTETIESGEWFNVSWVLNVSSTTDNETYLMDVYYNSSYGNTSVQENDTANRQVFLNLGGGGAADTCTYVSGAWTVDCSDNCVISSPVNLGGNDITISGTGTFTMTADVYNFDVITLEGTDSSNRCIATCDGGCFQT